MERSTIPGRHATSPTGEFSFAVFICTADGGLVLRVTLSTLRTARRISGGRTLPSCVTLAL
jgi:hypothetical protein